MSTRGLEQLSWSLRRPRSLVDVAVGDLHRTKPSDCSISIAMQSQQTTDETLTLGGTGCGPPCSTAWARMRSLITHAALKDTTTSGHLPEMPILHLTMNISNMHWIMMLAKQWCQYTSMSDPNLLKWLQKGQTQNNNECLNSVIWSRCTKTVVVGHQKLLGAVASAVGGFNEGATHLTKVRTCLELSPTRWRRLLLRAETGQGLPRVRRRRKAAQRCCKSRKRKTASINVPEPRRRKGQLMRLEDLSNARTWWTWTFNHHVIAQSGSC